MINLAGKEDCDEQICRELRRCLIAAVDVPRSTNEVPFSVIGKLGPYEFYRAWYYWVVKGPVPIDVARELYADPVGKEDVRIGGHCGCPPPGEYGTEFYDADGRHIYVDADGSQEKNAAADTLDLWHFVSSKEERATVATKAIVTTYHIDSEIGLRLFVDTIRKHGLDRPAPTEGGKGSDG